MYSKYKGKMSKPSFTVINPILRSAQPESEPEQEKLIVPNNSPITKVKEMVLQIEEKTKSGKFKLIQEPIPEEPIAKPEPEKEKLVFTNKYKI